MRSAPTWWLRGDSWTITPARNAPRARDTPNCCAARRARPAETASTTSRKSSRERVRAMSRSRRGTTRAPKRSIRPTKIPAFSSTGPMAEKVPAPPPARAGSRSRSTTVAMSSRTSQPTAARPAAESRRPSSMSPRSSTTVLAMESERPRRRLAGPLQPQSAPEAVAEGGGQRHLRDAPGNGDRAHAPQVLQGEMEPHAEHQEDHAQLGQLGDGLDVAHEAGGVGPYGHAREQVAHDRGHPGQAGQEAADERRPQGDGDVREKGGFVQGRLAIS